MLNKFIAIGYIGKKGIDIKLIKGSGTAVGAFQLAVEDNFKSKEGNKEYNYIPCKCWGQNAEWLSQNIDRIKKVSVEGEYKSFIWERDGKKNYGHEINCSSVQVVEWADKNEGNNSSNESNYNNDVTPIQDDEIPF